MESNIKIKVKYELLDFLKFNYWHIRKLKRVFVYFLCLWFLPVIIFFGKEIGFGGNGKGLFSLVSQYRWMFTIPVVLSLFVGFVYLNIYNIGKRAICKNPIWNEEKEITINDTGVFIVSESASMNLKWEHIVRFANIKELLVLYYSKSATILIPKRYINGKDNEILNVIEKNYRKMLNN